MRKIIIFCECYGQQNYALQLAIKNYRDHSVTIVIPMLYNLFKFFEVVNEKVFHNRIKLIYIAPFQTRWAKVKGVSRIPCLLLDIIKERHYLREIWDKYFVGLVECEVYFLSRGFNGCTFYLLKRLIKRNRLVYVSLDSFSPSHWEQYTPKSISELASLTISKLVYGREIMLGQLPYFKGFLFMPDKFINKKVDRIIGQAEIDEMMKEFDLSQFRVFNIDSYSVIYFDQPLVGVGYISDGNIYQQELSSVFNILGKYYPKEEIAIKYHPEFDGDRGLTEGGSILPSFIPAELLYNDKVKIYLGVTSMSISNVERGLVVSLIDLITFKSEEIKDKLRDDLIQVSKSEILFPKTLDEFERILTEGGRLKS